MSHLGHSWVTLSDPFPALLRRLRLGEQNRKKLEMWANAQRDGRPAEDRWRSLFNAAKFG